MPILNIELQYLKKILTYHFYQQSGANVIKKIVRNLPGAYPRVEHLRPYPQTIYYAGKACQGQTL
jgi:hypothetical protein